MKRNVKRISKALLLVLSLGIAGAGAFVWMQTRAFDASMDQVYDLPLTTPARSTDAIALARGKHLVESLAACAGTSCHGADLAGGATIDMGPVATLRGPNITAHGILAAYSDAQLFRLLRHGVRSDGRSVRFMPVQDMAWLSDADLTAIISYLRTAPAVDKESGATVIKTLGKIIDRRGGLVLDVARRVPHDRPDLAPPPAATKEYGSYAARLCTGCHGEHLSGGPLPGAPASFAIPLNLTPDSTGLKGWTYADFDKAMSMGVRKNGAAMNPMMPIDTLSKLDPIEKGALFAYLESLPPLPYGGR